VAGGEAREAFDLAASWKIIRMRFPWQPREYARTCAECGYIWRVPRWAAHRRVQSISMISVATRTNIDRGELARKIGSASAANQSADTFRHCPKCGADHFTQRPLRGELPA
jgi:DNA-directed RNA polymerase subunit M/transcription elongation factor TFIIS